MKTLFNINNSIISARLTPLGEEILMNYSRDAPLKHYYYNKYNKVFKSRIWHFITIFGEYIKYDSQIFINDEIIVESES